MQCLDFFDKKSARIASAARLSLRDPCLRTVVSTWDKQRSRTTGTPAKRIDCLHAGVAFRPPIARGLALSAIPKHLKAILMPNSYSSQVFEKKAIFEIQVFEKKAIFEITVCKKRC